MKKTFTTIALALVLTFGATFANAGIIISDKNEKPACTADAPEREGIIIFGREGIIIFGIIIFGKEEKAAPCAEAPAKDNAGIIIFG